MDSCFETSKACFCFFLILVMKKHKMHVHLGGSARLRAEPSKEALMARVACLALLSVASAGALAPPAVSTGSRSPSCAALSRRAALASSAAALFASSSAALAATTEAVAAPGDCRKDCFRECNALAPGNQAYCAAQCDSYCDGLGALGKDDVVRSDLSDAEASAAAPAVASSAAKDCSVYKTDAAAKYCEKENKEKAAALAAAKGDLSKNLGIFGDSGVEYSNGVEDFFATIFGAKQQNTNINKADIGAFTDDIAKAGQAAFFGK